jgi:hypothetical protein
MKTKFCVFTLFFVFLTSSFAQDQCNTGVETYYSSYINGESLIKNKEQKTILILNDSVISLNQSEYDYSVLAISTQDSIIFYHTALKSVSKVLRISNIISVQFCRDMFVVHSANGKSNTVSVFSVLDFSLISSKTIVTPHFHNFLIYPINDRNVVVRKSPYHRESTLLDEAKILISYVEEPDEKTAIMHLERFDAQTFDKDNSLSYKIDYWQHLSFSVTRNLNIFVMESFSKKLYLLDNKGNKIDSLQLPNGYEIMKVLSSSDKMDECYISDLKGNYSVYKVNNNKIQLSKSIPNVDKIIIAFTPYHDKKLTMTFKEGDILDTLILNDESSAETLFDENITAFTATEIICQGLESFENKSVTVFPNPTTGFLNLETKLTDFEVKIFDSMGKLILIDNKNELNLSSLKSGLYIIEISHNSEIVYKDKLLINN